MFQQDAAYQRAESGAARANRRPQTKRHVAVPRLRKSVTDAGKRRRDDHRRTNGQQRAGGDQRQRSG